MDSSQYLNKHRSQPSLTSLPRPRSYITSPPLPLTTSLLTSRAPPKIPISYSTPALHYQRSWPSPKPRRGELQDAHSAYEGLGEAEEAEEEEEGHEESWLLHTASTLTTASLEQKGHAWLLTRHSSTSLASSASPSPSPYAPPAAFFRAHPRAPLEFSSRATTATADVDLDRGGEEDGVMRSPRSGSRRGIQAREVMEADFLVKEEEEEEEDGRGKGGWDEGEMRKVVMGRVGGWVDWAVGWMDFRGDEDGEREEEVEEEEEEAEVKEKQGKEMDKREERTEKKGEGEPVEIQGRGGEEVVAVEVPPLMDGEGIWGDTKWLMKVAGKIAL